MSIMHSVRAKHLMQIFSLQFFFYVVVQLFQMPFLNETVDHVVVERQQYLSICANI